MAIKVHRIPESTSDSMIDVHATQSKPITDEMVLTAVSTSQSEEQDYSTYTPCSDVEMKYKIDHHVLGQGHHGSVRQCMDRSTGKRYAVKTICKNAPSVNIRGIQREVSLLESLKHERILQLHEVHEDSQYVHLVTELCSGGELFDKIVEKSSNGEGCFPESEAAKILQQILSAVSYMHQMNCVHRDIKPENILFETAEDGSDIKVIDFGLARKHKPGEAPMSTIVGTPYYLAPEVLQKNYGKACDMWSIGVIAYVLLCGYPPFNGPDNKEVYASVRRGTYCFPSAEWKHVSSAAKDFIVRLLQPDPRRRMTADQALNHPWIRNFLSTSPVKATEHHDAIHIVQDDTESCTSFVEVVLDGALSLNNESIVCGGSCLPPTAMHC